MDIENNYGLKECQQNLLRLMSVFDKLCRENDIVYCVDSGTLLGTIRHNGFIPWDDDLDVVVDRDNYDKLMKVNFEIYGLRYIRNTFIESLCLSDSSKSSKKLVLDIFTIDNTPDSSFARKLKIAHLIMIHGMWHHYFKEQVDTHSFVKKVYSFIFRNIGRFYSEEQIFKIFQRVSKKDNNRKTKYVQCFNYMSYELNVRYPSDILKEIERHQFESIEVNVPKLYDVYLSNLYGDWKTPKKTKTD